MNPDRPTPSPITTPSPSPSLGWLDSPPLSCPPSLFLEDDSIAVIATDEQGMIADDELELPHASNKPAGALTATVDSVPDVPALTKRPRQPRKYVSKHFQPSRTERKRRSQLQPADLPATVTPPLTPQLAKERERRIRNEPRLPETNPRIVNGVDIDEAFSSDSSLTSVPSDIGPDPFSPSAQKPTKRRRRALHPTKSPYFPRVPLSKLRRSSTTTTSVLPFPPLAAPRFGLMQERLAHDPFRLLIATIFLNKTPGARAMPVFYDLMARYPTPAALAVASVTDVAAAIHSLGFQNQRARKCVAMAKVWVGQDGPGDGIADGVGLSGEPRRGRRWAKRDYPCRGDGRDVSAGECIGDNDDDARVAWEISHLPGLGAYAHDSWRMFCRDQLRRVAQGWNGEGTETTLSADRTTITPITIETAREGETPNDSLASAQQHPHDTSPFEPEWKRVQPADKELRAWMTWMWLKEGWLWNKATGGRTRASAELMARAHGGGILREEMEKECLVVEAVDWRVETDGAFHRGKASETGALDTEATTLDPAATVLDTAAASLA